uniref:ETFB lysine methyltransferase n=1 Tax=Aegilops tauschii TaxID=37682 RepID=N1QR18_AEGTA
MAGAGMVLRDSSGSIIFSSCRQLRRCADALEAELAACMEGLNLALQWTPLPVELETDNLVGINMLRGNTVDRSRYAMLIDQTRRLLRGRREELLSESLLCFGACSVTVDDITDAANLDEISITTIYAHGENVGSSISNAASSAGLDYSPAYETTVGKQCDWVTLVQETYESTKVIDDLWIIPKWKTPPDPQATNIIINPGLAFGTGEHPTTKLCLLFLKEVIKGGEHVMDYGTGTGVLGIAALKMGAALSTGIDIDPQAVRSARENMLLNGMDSDRMLVHLVPTGAEPSCFSSSIDKSEEEKPGSNLELKSSKGTHDIVAANILLNPLLELVEDIVGFAKTGGTVAVSGILCEQSFVSWLRCFSWYLTSYISSNIGSEDRKGLLQIDLIFPTGEGFLPLQEENVLALTI